MHCNKTFKKCSFLERSQSQHIQPSQKTTPAHPDLPSLIFGVLWRVTWLGDTIDSEWVQRQECRNECFHLNLIHFNESVAPEARNARGDGLPLLAGLNMDSCITRVGLCRMWTTDKQLKILCHVYIILGLLCAVLWSLHRIKSNWKIALNKNAWKYKRVNHRLTYAFPSEEFSAWEMPRVSHISAWAGGDSTGLKGDPRPSGDTAGGQLGHFMVPKITPLLLCIWVPAPCQHCVTGLSCVSKWEPSWGVKPVKIDRLNTFCSTNNIKYWVYCSFLSWFPLTNLSLIGDCW